ncbi:hypothetical protein ALC60_03970 [Trachymyrmex zeteki]|uniref:Uncharacterized protein n=1 Tax=Mycetomoellerius zeteki TaxID=64791 RepID=A0A151X9E0_9HYME|nr:hypothetical protein ALC60_03970 [Trachymyrmex zeteki]
MCRITYDSTRSKKIDGLLVPLGLVYYPKNPEYQLIFKAAWDLTQIDSLKFTAVALRLRAKGRRWSAVRMSSVAHGEEMAKWWCIYYVGMIVTSCVYSLDVDQADGLRMSWQLRILPGRSKEAANRRNPLIPSIRRVGQ